MSHPVQQEWLGICISNWMLAICLLVVVSGCQSEQQSDSKVPQARAALTAVSRVLPQPTFDAVRSVGEANLPLSDLGAKGQSERALALIFISDVCPICNRYSPEMRRLADEYAEHVDVRLVYPLPDANAQQLEQHSQDYGIDGLTLWDPRQQLSRWSGASVTPEAVVLAPKDATYKLLYRGRIDNWYVDFGKPRSAPTLRDLRDVLDAIAAGSPKPFLETEAVGCTIPTLPN